MADYSKNYSENSLWGKIKKVAIKAGAEVIYKCLLLFYVLQKSDVPVWAKATITGALGYFIFPMDAIPDLIPGVGYTDDLGAIVAALGLVSMYIDDEVRKKAKDKMFEWFDESDLDDIGNWDNY